MFYSTRLKRGELERQGPVLMRVSPQDARLAPGPGQLDDRDRFLLLCLAAVVVVAYTPTYVKLIEGPWRTEQEGHGPFIIAASAWLTWQCKDRLRTIPLFPAPLSGWGILLAGLALMIVSRSQNVLLVEVASQIPIICGCILLTVGWGALRVLAFPIGFLIFSVPPPGWMMDALTVPLKTKVSDWVAQFLYTLDYPVAQNGVMIMIAQYQLMVKDACAGMNSILALSAIGIFYIYEFTRESWARSTVLALSIVPISIAANVVRVLALVLLAYYQGIGAVDGIYHDLTGILLFCVALGMFFGVDSAVAVCTAVVRRLRQPRVDAERLEDRFPGIRKEIRLAPQGRDVAVS